MYTYVSNKAAHVLVQDFMQLPWYQQQQQGKPLYDDLPIRSFSFETWKGASGYQTLENQWNVHL